MPTPNTLPPKPSTKPSTHGFLTRLIALIKKETRQLLRDRSNLLIGLGLPIVLIFIFGYGVSLDVKNIRLAVVADRPSQASTEFAAGLELSRYFLPQTAASLIDAKALMRTGEVEGVVHLAANFADQLQQGQARVQILISGEDVSRASSIQSYFDAYAQQWVQKRLERSQQRVPMGVQVDSRVWFNDANTSTWFLIPGLIVLIMTLVGTFLTALVMAREWERGTLEALFVTPVRPTEILLAKIAPYFVVGLIGLGLCMLAARWLFDVPMKGSFLLILLGSMLYMLVSLGIGLLISAVTRNQFLASQIALLASFLPAMMLSGFVFDLRNIPVVVQWVGYALPATYFMELMKTLFLAGNVPSIVIKDCLLLALYSIVLLGGARAVTRKRLD